jgi:predicted secreted Zn-dependent protease
MRFSSISRRLHARRTVWLSAFVSVLLMAAYLYAASLFLHASSPQTTVEAASVKNITAEQASTPTCTVASFDNPAPVNLASAPTGLSIVNDPVAQYQIYGTTASQLRSQMRKCAPGANGDGGAEFTGQTAYTLTWQYGTTVGDKCSVANAKVGLHIATILPSWRATSAAKTGLNTRWQGFMTNLTTHEAGHAALDKLYAQQVLNDLRTMPPMDCTKLETIVEHVVDSDVATLNMANANYDTTTDHGATQGAVIPSY